MPKITLECHSEVLHILNQSDKDCSGHKETFTPLLSEEFVTDVNRIGERVELQSETSRAMAKNWFFVLLVGVILGEIWSANVPNDLNGMYDKTYILA